MEETENSPKTEKPWLFKKGQSGNPGGRPKGTMKEYLSRKFREMSDEEKELFLSENKVSGKDMIEFAEGKAESKTDITSGGQPIIQVAGEIITKHDINPSSVHDSQE